MIRVLLALGALATVGSAESAPAKSRFEWRREAAAARQRHDFSGMTAAAEAAVTLQPDAPRDLLLLATAQTLAGQPAQAGATLERVAALALWLPLEQYPDFAPLRERPEFKAVLGAMAANRRPRGAAKSLLTVAGFAGIAEGLARRELTGDFFVGDVRDRCVWRVTADGQRSRFSAAEAGFLGVFKLQVDEPRGLLWLSTSAVPEISGYTPALKGQGELAALDLATGRVVQRHPLPEDGADHCLGDFILGPDGAIYVTDSVAPVIWRLRPDGEKLEVFLESREFVSLQGIGFLPDGRRLVITDYARGVATVDLASRAVTFLAAPPNATLVGLDSLAVRDGAILAVQNGIEPQRLVRVTLPATATEAAQVEVLAAGLPEFDDLTHFVAGPSAVTVIARSGWSAFDGAQAPPPPHPVRLMMVPVGR